MRPMLLMLPSNAPRSESVTVERIYAELLAADQQRDAIELLAVLSTCHLAHLRLLLPSWAKTRES